MNIVRSFLLYVLWFFVCTILVATVLKSLPDGFLVLFAFGAPVFAVRLHNKRRAIKVSQTRHTDNDLSMWNRIGQSSARRSTDSFLQPKQDNSALIAAGRAARGDLEEAAKRYAKKQPEKPAHSLGSAKANTGEEVTFEPVATRQAYHPKQDNSTLIAAGRAAKADLEKAAKKYAKPKWMRTDAAEEAKMPLASNEKPQATEQSTLDPSVKSGWVPAGTTVLVAGRRIAGMVYVGAPPNVGQRYFREACRAYIDPALSVSELAANHWEGELGYWPSYSEATAKCRATYLDWLADGARDTSINIGYVFLYFYGLERRLFIDKPEQKEQTIILAEADRLLELFGSNHSIKRYIGELVETASIVFAREEQIEPIFESRSWELPLSVRMKIGSLVRDGERVSADWILSWYLCSGHTNLRTPARRCAEEFRVLFKVLHEKKYPGGQKVRKPKGWLEYQYRAASSEFNLDIEPTVDGFRVPDITSLVAPLNRAQMIADQASDALDKYSRFLGRDLERVGSVEAHALLPIEIRAHFPCEGMDALDDWANSIISTGGLVKATDLIGKLENAKPDRISKRQLTDAADALAGLAIGMAPDPRFGLRAPKADEPVILFDLGEPVTKLEDVSSGYEQALLEMALGSFIAHADGEVVEAEHVRLVELATNAPVANEAERKRLHANRSWFEAVKPDINMLRKRLKSASADDALILRAAAVAMAHADMAIVPEEVAGIEKIYAALGLERSLVYADLHARDITDGPVSVRAAIDEVGGEAIPADKQSSLVTLDLSKIAAIRSNTDRVSLVLGEIFGAGEESGSAKAALIHSSCFTGLDTVHSKFVRELITKESWSEDELAAIAAVSKLPLTGMIESVNEWSFETHDEMLIDDYNGYEILPDTAEAVRLMMKKES